MTRDRKAAAPAREAGLYVDAWKPVETVRMRLGEFNDELDGGEVEFRVEDGGLVVSALEPEGDPVFRAMPNAGIEHHVRLALRALLMATADRPVVDAEGRRVHAENCMLYPEHMEEAPSRRPTELHESRVRTLAGAGVGAAVVTLFLIAAGLAHPLVALLIPGVGIGAWSLLQATRPAEAGVTALPDYPSHLRRGRAQGRSISSAANRARGLST